MGNKSFADILVDKILEKESRTYSDVRDTSPAHLAFLMGNIEKVSFQSKSQYPVQKPQQAPKPRPAHTFNEQQKNAFQFFSKWVPHFRDNFSQDELKMTFRQLAKAFHPDTASNKKNVEYFLELKKSFDTLKTVFNT